MQTIKLRSIYVSTSTAVGLAAAALIASALLAPAAHAQPGVRVEAPVAVAANIDTSLAKLEAFFEGPQLHAALKRLTQGVELNALLGAVEQVVSAEVHSAVKTAAEAAVTGIDARFGGASVDAKLPPTVAAPQPSEAQAIIQAQTQVLERNVQGLVREAAPVVVALFAEVFSGVLAEAKWELQQTWVREVLFK